MVSLFRELQSGKVKLFVAGTLDNRELEVEPLIGGTLSYPPDDLFHTVVVKDSAAIEIVEAEEIFLAREGISLEGLDNQAERLAMDDRFNETRLKVPSPQRYGFEIHSDDGRRINAISVEAISTKPIKSLYDADTILITAYDGSVNDKGEITSAEIHPVAIKLNPKLYTKPLPPQHEVIANPELSPIKFVGLAHAFKFKPAPPTKPAAPRSAVMLPGLGANVKQDGGFGQFLGKSTSGNIVLPDNLLGTTFKAPATPFVAATATTAHISEPLTTKDSPLFEASELCANRFLVSLMVMHVMSREKELIKKQTTEPGGTVNAGRKRGKRTGIYQLTVDPDEFALIVSKRADDIERVLMSGKGYSAKGLVLVRKHERKTPSGGTTDVTTHARCEDKAVEAEAKRLLLLPDSIDKYRALARLVEQWGNPQTKDRLNPVYQVAIAHPTRSNPEPTEAKTTRAP